jgi:hypothetical protein
MDALYKADKDHNYYENVLAAEFKKKNFFCIPHLAHFILPQPHKPTQRQKKAKSANALFVTLDNGNGK